MLARIRQNLRMARKRRTNQDAKALIPWWGWVGAAAVAWLIGRALIASRIPQAATVQTTLVISVFKGIGYFVSAVGPIVFGWFALSSAVAAIARKKEAAVLDTTRIEPTMPPDFERVHLDTPVSALDTTRWTLVLLKALEWKRFEQLSALYFRTLKFKVEEADVGPDGGIDLRLYAEGVSPHGARRPDIIVQCKAWNTWKVGVKELRELFGVMAAEGVSEGIFVTSSSFTHEAAAFARGKNIALIDGDDFLRKICDLPAEDQSRLLAAATAGDFSTPTCPSCATKMVRRAAKNNGELFWGCPRFPACRRTMQISATAQNQSA
jgi:restriction system protein